MPSSAVPITQLLRDCQNGDSLAENQLVQLVYSQLRQIAVRLLRSERPNHTLQPTALVNEAYIRLMRGKVPTWQNRAHFFGTATRAMRQVLKDYGRKRMTDKRGNGQTAIPLEESVASQEDAGLSVWLRFDEALERLSELDERQSQIAELRVLGAMTIDEIAKVLGLGPTTVKQEWGLAKAWLRKEMEPLS